MSDPSLPGTGPRPAVPPLTPSADAGAAPPAAHLLPHPPAEDPAGGWLAEDALPDEGADEEC